MSIRVCHVCSGHRDDDARVYERECVSLAEAGYDVHLVARSTATEPFCRRGVTIHPVPVFSSRLARLLCRKRVADLAASLCPDVYHVHEPELLRPILRRADGRPVIWDVHEPYLENIRTKHWIPRPLRLLVRLAWDRLERSLVRRCAAVVPATQWLAPRYYDLNNRVVALANFPRLPDHVETSPVPRRANALVFTGSIFPNRGMAGALQAMAILQQKGIVVTFDLAGAPLTPKYLDELMRAAERLGVLANVTFHGYLPLEEVRRLQQTCGIGYTAELMAAGSQVGYPVKMFEFMMHGLPLVYSDFPVFRTVAAESDAGIAVDPTQPQQIADAIERLVADPVLARRLGENGRRAVYERFNWDAEWPKLRDLYLELVGPPTSASGETRP